MSEDLEKICSFIEKNGTSAWQLKMFIGQCTKDNGRTTRPISRGQYLRYSTGEEMLPLGHEVIREPLAEGKGVQYLVRQDIGRCEEFKSKIETYADDLAEAFKEASKQCERAGLLNI